MTLSRSDIVALICRLTVGVVFCVSGADKIAGIDAFSAAIEHYKLVPPSVALLIATILPWAELLCGLGLVSGLWSRGSALLTSLFLAVFIVAVLSAMARNLDISCGCFTHDPQAGRVGWQRVIEDLLLFCASLVVLFSRNTPYFLKGNSRLTAGT